MEEYNRNQPECPEGIGSEKIEVEIGICPDCGARALHPRRAMAQLLFLAGPKIAKVGVNWDRM